MPEYRTAVPAHGEEFRPVEGAPGTGPDFEPDNTCEKEGAAGHGRWGLGVALRFRGGEKSGEDDGFGMKGSFVVVVVQFAGLDEGAVEEGGGQGAQFLCRDVKGWRAGTNVMRF